MGISSERGRASMQNCILFLHLPVFFFSPLFLYEALSWDSVYLLSPYYLILFSFGVSGCLQAAGLLVVVECGWEEEIDAGLRG